jgi:hypothetical protein
MTAGDAGNGRSAALDAYLAERADDGYRVETRSSLQAVICRRHRLFFLLRWVAAGKAERRFVVSVDQHGQVTAAAAEPVRW